MKHASSLVIDALAAGKLADDEAEAARVHIATCTRCGADLAAAEAACAEFARQVFSRTMATAACKRRRWSKIVPKVVLPALAVAALVLVLRAGHEVPTVSVDETHAIRSKGGLSLQVFANRDGKVSAIRDGARLAPGDSLRFVVGADGPRFLLVASIDGAGNATIYFPYRGDKSGVATRERSELPGSIVLDGAPGPERVFALGSHEPLDAEVVKRALQAIGRRGPAAIRDTRALPVEAAAQATIVFEKDTP